MILTTEPRIHNKSYEPILIISGIGVVRRQFALDNLEDSLVQLWDLAIGQALAALEREGLDIYADGIVGVQVSTSESTSHLQAIVMGTAIRFQEN